MPSVARGGCSYLGIGTATTGNAGHLLFRCLITSPAAGLVVTPNITPSIAIGARSVRVAQKNTNMGRQLFNDGPFVDTIIASPTANTTNTITPLWVAATWTPIFANDPKAGKIYCVRAGGIVTSGTAGSTMIITPKYGTGGTALGAS